MFGPHRIFIFYLLEYLLSYLIALWLGRTQRVREGKEEGSGYYYALGCVPFKYCYATSMNAPAAAAPGASRFKNIRCTPDHAILTLPPNPLPDFLFPSLQVVLLLGGYVWYASFIAATAATSTAAQASSGGSSSSAGSVGGGVASPDVSLAAGAQRLRRHCEGERHGGS